MGKILHWLQERIKHWTKPATSVLIIGILSDLTRSRYRSGCRKCVVAPTIDRAESTDQATSANQL